MARGLSAFGASVETGFADHAHFTRSFKRLVGVTPSRYQRAIAGHKVNFIRGF